MTPVIDTLRNIRNRRSTRHFTDKTPSDRIIHRLLEAGRWAPSGLNNQPWRFSIIKHSEQRRALAQLTTYGAIIRRAPVLIVIAIDPSSSYNREKDLMAIGAAIQNIQLAATSLRLGTCWLGEILNRKDEVAGLLGWKKGLELTAVLALGTPKKRNAVGRRKPLKQLMIPA